MRAGYRRRERSLAPSHMSRGWFLCLLLVLAAVASTCQSQDNIVLDPNSILQELFRNTQPINSNNNNDNENDEVYPTFGRWPTEADRKNEALLVQLAGIGPSQSLPAPPTSTSTSTSTSAEVYVLEEKDYPKFLFENYTGVGQVSGLAALPTDDLALLHRAGREWTQATFGLDNKIPRSERRLISNDTIMFINGDDGRAMDTFGANLFQLPHSIESDRQGNLWVSDVGLHQVMRLPAALIDDLRKKRHGGGGGKVASELPRASLKPDIVLGERYVPGNDSAHFCKPSEVRISPGGELVYIADGYCNNRVVVYSARSGDFIKSFGEPYAMRVVHSLTLIEKRNLLCVADREQSRILCFKAGLDGDLDSLGELALQLHYPLGKIYAILAVGPNHMLVSSRQINSNHYDLATLSLISGEIRQVWVSSDLIEPHSLTKTLDGYYVYAADLSNGTYKKIFKFNVVKRDLVGRRR